MSLWWKIGVYADAIPVVRLLNREACRLRPERSVLYRSWSWMAPLSSLDITVPNSRRHYSLGDYLDDLRFSLEDVVWPDHYSKVSYNIKLFRRKTVRSPHIYGEILCSSFGDVRDLWERDLERPVYLREERLHVMYRVPSILLRKLRKHHPQVLALVY